MRCAVKRILENHPAINFIDQAKNGKEALDKVKVNDCDIIFLDIEMPVMNGIEFVKRCIIHSSALIVILSTIARHNSVQIEETLFYGAHDVVAKPVEAVTR